MYSYDQSNWQASPGAKMSGIKAVLIDRHSVPIVCPKLDAYKPQLFEWLVIDLARAVWERHSAM
jgi:hypothetical protein